jgi:hypothetical protein
MMIVLLLFLQKQSLGVAPDSQALSRAYLLEVVYSRTTSCMDPEDTRCATIT